MSTAHHPEAIAKEIKRYWKVFAALTVGTIITVAVANVHLGILLGIVVALIVAIVKGSLVAGYFMHLHHERTIIYFILGLTAVFVAAMVVLMMWTTGDQQGAPHGAFIVPQKHILPGEHAVGHAAGAAAHPAAAVPAHAEE